jgi:hypothetical protein
MAHLSQYSVSIATGIDRSRLSSIENGYISPQIDEVEQIERFVSEAQCQQVARLKRVLSLAQLDKDRHVGNRSRKVSKRSAGNLRGPDKGIGE